ncbi:MAG: single-stranded-DNA-specific exonuclease RecJ [Cytophagales bacterium]|nr:single-stranded-DNA-specific exonuclease RecJ [Cytophagales bacterium]
MSDKLWKYKNDSIIKDRNKCLDIILVDYGIITTQQKDNYFNLSLDKLYDPFLISNIHQAVDIILSALSSGERITIFGDYDVDGVTSTALLYNFLTDHFSPVAVDYLVGDRRAGGYGLSLRAVEDALNNNTSLLITVDCGIKDFTTIRQAVSDGMKVIVLDHHEPEEDSHHPATVVIDLKQKECHYPFLELSACGVAFKLICAILKTINKPYTEAYKYLDLVGLSTACDLVPLIDENRTLMYYGLQQLHETSNTGLRQMINLCTLDSINIDDILFKLGPRLNAAGRMSSAMMAVQLLTTKDEQLAYMLSQDLDSLNSQRKKLCSDITSSVDKLLDNNKSTTVLYSPTWHQGVIGIVASQCLSTKYCPTIIMTRRDNVIVGSCRSTKDINIYQALEQCKDLLLGFGGHSLAAGITLEEQNIEPFKERFEKVISTLRSGQQQTPILAITCQLAIEVVDKEFCEMLFRCEPFGVANEKPIFVSQIQNYSYSIYRNSFVIKINNNLFAIGYHMSDKEHILTSKRPLLMAYSISNMTSKDIVLTIKDIKEE